MSNDAPDSDLSAILKTAMTITVDAKPVSDILTDLQRSAELLDVHARYWLSQNDSKRYLSLNALSVSIKSGIHFFEREAEEKVEDD